ncbi:MAG: outer membrane beta-barrel protein [Chitinophagales bacterium]|nr:outer membrane beta-barrel protein [Chitinophagales bacterium]
MHTINIWHKHHIHSRKVIVFIAILFLSVASFAQKYAYENDMKFAKKPYHFGIHLATNYSDFRIRHSEAFATSDSVAAVGSDYKIGFEIGALFSWHINKYVEVRTLPTFVFADKNLNYQFTDETRTDLKISQIYYEMPFEMKFKSEAIKNFKVYLVGGLKYGYDLGANLKNRKFIDLPKQKAHDLAANYGFGFEFHFPFFILSPEFKVSNSLLNMHINNDALIYSKMINRLGNRSFQFSINFEG